MRVLVVDNTIDPDSWGSRDLSRMAASAPGATVAVRRAPHRDLPASPRGFDRIIVSGSKTSVLEDAPWIEELHEFVRQTLNENIPFLGVCFGHQTLARVLGGKSTCRRAQTPEIGWTKIEITEPSPLLAGLPESFYTFSSHVEEVASLPPQLKSVARSEACAIQACHQPGQPVFGIQFHPERDLQGAEETFSRKKKDAQSSKFLLHLKRSKELYDPQIGERIFRNFLEIG